MQELLLKSFHGESCNGEIAGLSQIYEEHIDFDDLRAQLNMLPQILKKKEVRLQGSEHIRCYSVYADFISIRERIFVRSHKSCEIDPSCPCN